MNTSPMFNSLSNQKFMIFPGADLLEQLKVRGVEGAKSFQTQQNTRIPLFDQDEDYIYIVTTDENGNKTNIVRCKFTIDPIPKPEDIFASKEDLNTLKGDIADVKQLIQQLSATLSAVKSDGTNGGSTQTARPNG